MLVKLENVQKHYKDFTLQCSLEMEEGKITGILGANGSGKTTTFKTIVGLIHPDGGKVEVFGKCPDTFSMEDKKRLGVVLSESGFSEYLTIKEVRRILSAMYEDFDMEMFDRQCKRFALPEKKRIRDFSTGMKAKLKVLVAVTHGADLLILDEPTAGLDVVARQDVLDLLREYMETDGRSIFISSHISSDLEGFCDDFYLLHKGNILLHEDTDALLSNYGVLKVTEEEYDKLEKEFILGVRKEPYGYRCLTKERQFFMENYPHITIEKGTLDEMMLILIEQGR